MTSISSTSTFNFVIASAWLKYLRIPMPFSTNPSYYDFGDAFMSNISLCSVSSVQMFMFKMFCSLLRVLSSYLCLLFS